MGAHRAAPAVGPDNGVVLDLQYRMKFGASGADQSVAGAEDVFQCRDTLDGTVSGPAGWCPPQEPDPAGGHPDAGTGYR